MLSFADGLALNNQNRDKINHKWIIKGNERNLANIEGKYYFMTMMEAFAYNQDWFIGLGK